MGLFLPLNYLTNSSSASFPLGNICCLSQSWVADWETMATYAFSCFVNDISDLFWRVCKTKTLELALILHAWWWTSKGFIKWYIEIHTGNFPPYVLGPSIHSLSHFFTTAMSFICLHMQHSNTSQPLSISTSDMAGVCVFEREREQTELWKLLSLCVWEGERQRGKEVISQGSPLSRQRSEG